MPGDAVVLDHVAVAVEAWADAWGRYVVELGGRWASGGLNVGFGPAQLRFANDARVEVLQPWQAEANPFLRRFLDTNGPGPHHLTFKVPDIAHALEAAASAGFTAVQVDLSDPEWKEAFLHPRQATGVVVQMAQAAGSWESPPPEGFPTDAPHGAPAAFTHVTHAVADLDDALALFSGLLGGELAERHHDTGAGWHGVTLRWPGPLGLRLITPTGDRHGVDAPGSALHRWLGDRPGRVHHLAFARTGPLDPGSGPEPAEAPVPGVTEAEQPLYVVAPEDNLGARLVVRRSLQ
ncbi:MAG TPA: VOC family protein [Acidimicrobiales bacterium]|nr:VOC family protein [Acidimicrobiales bacterium]